MTEMLILDPNTETGRAELAINDGSIRVAADGADWGNAEVQQYQAEAQRGQSAVDFRYPNRTITLPLVVQASAGTTFVSARQNLHNKVALIQQEGGVLKRVLSTGGTLYADIVNATLSQGNQWTADHKGVEPGVTLTLETIPDLYGPEETLSDHVEASGPSLSFVETNIKGDYPGRVRMVVDEDQGQNQRGLIWSFRSRHYDSAVTAAPAFNASILTALDTATKVAMTGSSGGTAITHGTIAPVWTPVASTYSSFGEMTHTGTYRVKARVATTSGTASNIETRFVWDVGDFVNPTENNPVRMYNSGTFSMVDLGEMRIDPAPSGTHQWKGQVQARGVLGTENFTLDRLWFVNTDDGYGQVMAPASSVVSSTFTARDSFNGPAGNVHGTAAIVGGAWDTTEAGTDGTDFAVESTGHTAQRSEVSDASSIAGRPALIGGAVAACTVQVDAKFSALPTGLYVGAVARWVDASNYLRAFIRLATSGGGGMGAIVVEKVIAGTPTTLGSSTASVYYSVLNLWYTLRLSVDTAGNWSLAPFVGGGPASVLSGSDPVLATGGTLDDGRAGFYDVNTSASASTRNYDNFYVWTPDSNAVMFATQSLELATEGITREDSGGTSYSPAASVVGDLPRIPASGLENRSTEVLLKASRGDLTTMADPAIDDISARVYYRPSYMFVPE